MLPPTAVPAKQAQSVHNSCIRRTCASPVRQINKMRSFRWKISTYLHIVYRQSVRNMSSQKRPCSEDIEQMNRWRGLSYMYQPLRITFTYNSLDETTVVSSGVASNNTAIRHYGDVPSASFGIHI